MSALDPKHWFRQMIEGPLVNTFLRNGPNARDIIEHTAIDDDLPHVSRLYPLPIDERRLGLRKVMDRLITGY